MSYERLPFWSFFHAIEQQLSYERWIDKYQLFITALLGQDIPFDPDWVNLRVFCKALYLQNHTDELLFDQLLDMAIVREQEWLLAQLAKGSATTGSGESPLTPTSVRDRPEVKNEDAATTSMERTVTTQGVSKTAERNVRDDSTTRTMYYLPSFEQLQRDPEIKERYQPRNFLLTDEYFPVTRRQMVKAWQFLRHKEKGRQLEGIDISATIEKIAKDGLFLEPVYRAGMRNREDTLIIFADYRGSMTPFHELTTRLIDTARGEGRHQRAQVFYFQNYPVGIVYRHPNLTGPVKIKEALLKTNRNFTLAVVISDAGAARGNTEDAGVRTRYTMTDEFLRQLDQSCARTIWLNPMPRHRWTGTAAEKIEKRVFLMTPLLEQETSFQDTLRSILKQNMKKSQASK